MVWTRVRVVAVLVATVSVLGCNPKPGELIGDPPPPPQPREAMPAPAFQDVPAPPDRTAKAEEPAKAERVVKGEASWKPGKPDQWTHIILHHSATDFGNAAMFDRLHRQRNWDELGYHFVIDNGDGGAAGVVEVGSRWRKQKHGAHCRVDPRDANTWNEHGIGICLVGDFTSRRPSEAQMASAVRLIAYLMRTCNIPKRNILGHEQVPGAQTACPGKRFPYGELLRRVAAALGE